MKIFKTAALIFATFTQCVAIADEKYGFWEVGTSQDYAYAITTNDSGSALVQFCSLSNANCVWGLIMSSQCKENDMYPVLANSNISTASMILTCYGRVKDNPNAVYKYAFSEYETVNNIVKQGLEVGFAFPLSGTQFKVVRFSLEGSSTALDQLFLVTKAASTSPVRKDEIMY